MKKFLGLLYGLLAFLVGMSISLWQILFVGDLYLKKTIDRGGFGFPVWLSLCMDSLLLGLFATQHSLMARPWFKSWWTRLVPLPLERSTYMFSVGFAMAMLFHLWQPLPNVIWTVNQPLSVALLWVVFTFGWILIVWSAALIGPFDMWGLKQSTRPLAGMHYEPPDPHLGGPYRFIRHPIMLGLFLAYWAAPVMTVGRAYFALFMTVYGTIATRWEERDLCRDFPEYEVYCKSTPMILPWPRNRNHS